MESEWHWGNKWWAQDISSWWLHAQDSGFVPCIDGAENQKICVKRKGKGGGFRSGECKDSVQFRHSGNYRQRDFETFKTSCLLKHWHSLHQISSQAQDRDNNNTSLSRLQHLATICVTCWKWQNERSVALWCYHLPQKVTWVCTRVSGTWKNPKLSGVIQW